MANVIASVAIFSERLRLTQQPRDRASGVCDELDLESVCIGEVSGVVLIAPGVGMPVCEEERPAVLERLRDDLVTFGDGAGVKGEVIEAWPQPVVRRPGQRG